MVFFKYGFIFLAGAALGTAMAHRGQHHRHGHCWRRRHGGDRGRWHEQEAAQPASYGDEKYQQQERRGAHYYDGRPDAADRDTEERAEYRRSVKNKKSSAGAAAAVTSDDY